MASRDWPGSSPLTRGKLPQLAFRLNHSGLIPAHAGKTSSPTSSTSRTRAHPRSRGENANLRHTFFLGRGSSPLTRGKLETLTDNAPLLGLIPAHAGKTAAAAGVIGTFVAHPRSRGENWRVLAK